GRSVPCRRITWYCSGVSRRRHSSSVRVTGNCLVSMVPLLAVCRGLDRIDFFSPVMHGLPRIHLLRKKSFEVDGLPGHKRVYARLRRAMPGNDGFAWHPCAQTLRSSSSIDTPSGARRKATRTPGRTVVGSRVNSTPLALSSATIASMPLTVSPKWSSPWYGVTGGGLTPSPAVTGAMKMLAPPSLRSMRGLPCCMLRTTSAPSMRSYHWAVRSGSVVRRWMGSQVYLAIVSLPLIFQMFLPKSSHQRNKVRHFCSSFELCHGGIGKLRLAGFFSVTLNFFQRLVTRIRHDFMSGASNFS